MGMIKLLRISKETVIELVTPPFYSRKFEGLCRVSVE